MAFKFMKKVQQTFNGRRANRKKMHKRLPERTNELNENNSAVKAEPTTASTAVESSLKTTDKSTDNKTISTSTFDDAEIKKENQPDDSVNQDDISAKENLLENTKENHPSVKQELKKASTHQDSTIIVIYQDENHKSLSSPQIISGKRGETINFNFKEFKHYDLINIAGFTSVFVEPYGSITLTYRRQSGANIWLFSQDIDDMHMLGKPRFVTGKVDEKYALTPPDFIGYNLLRAEGPVKGSFNEKQQVVTYYYRDATWKEVDFNVKYLKMKVSQPGFDAPRGNDTYITLAKGTVWQVFESVHLTNGERWHCLGGNLWIKEDYDLVQFVDSLPQYAISDTEGYQFSIDLNVPAIVDFVPGKKLTLYNRPFGDPVDSIEDGSIVTITERQGGREMQWFKVDDRGWTIRQYLDLDIEHKVAQEHGRLK